MSQSSPGYLQVSQAAAMTLGLRKGLFHRDARLHCLNLLLSYPSGCRASCSYCGLSKEAGGPLPGEMADRSFIRVEWPIFKTDEIIERANRTDGFERACISSITHPDSARDTLCVLKKLKRQTSLPVSILSNPTTTSSEDIRKFKDAGADRFTVAIDLASEQLFDRHRGAGIKGPHRWKRYWDTLKEAADVFGEGAIGAHLIAGMGETEKEMLYTIQKVADLGGETHLFSFYPEKGSALGEAKPCNAGQYRRIQLGRYLIDSRVTRVGRMRFDDEGAIVNFGVGKKLVEKIFSAGRPFETCGCPGKDGKTTACNRPYGDGPPSDIRSFPFRLNSDDVDLVKKQMEEKSCCQTN